MSLVTNEECLNPLLVNAKQKSQSTKGLKVLAIDDNVVCLKVLGSVLEKCGYTVTTTRNANEGLEMLRKNKESFDIVITDVVRDDMDGFKLLEAIGLEMDIPVIMTSANGDTRTIVEGIKNGARDYLVKPVKMEDVKNIIQHVTSKNTIEEDESPISGNDTNIDTNELVQESSTLLVKRKSKNSLQYEDEETNTGSSGGESCPPRKKNRMRWSKEMHQKFLDAYYQLEADSLDKVVPKRILEIMNEPGITRENVASHLQKFRNGLKKQNAILNQDSHWKSDANNIARKLPETSNNNMFANHKACLVPRNQYEQVLFQQNALPVGNFAPISTYSMLDNRVYRPVLDANALSQPDLKRWRRKMDDELLKIPHNYANFGSGQFYQDPVSSAPVSLNYVGTPYQMFGQVSVSPQMTYISPFDSTGLVSSTPGQLEGGDLVSLNGRGVPDFGVGANGSPINFSLDDDLSTIVQQFQDISAPRL
ncbi:two-component response regulator arr10 [Nicotiana attenuata]|uniref:Two-component response regulator arr10 n=1 Tax=Nicotiana attenuata TaxID=49451 RepID=A0A1J6I9C3_NICAT|nr:two-component response regulator arr10 [Nicotiana attenuata]